MSGVTLRSGEDLSAPDGSGRLAQRDALPHVSEQSLLSRFTTLLTRPLPALPLDVFRVSIGLITLAYFARTLLEVPLFGAVDGLIDHELMVATFPFTALSPLHAMLGLGVGVQQVVFVIGCLAAVAITVGVAPRGFAAVAYVIAVSAYRWNFLVMYVDDAIVHLMLFWLMVLPVGRTLTLAPILRREEGAWRRWREMWVPGAAVRCFVWNVMLIYLVAGLWKWTSPMWRDGTALYAALKLPVSIAPDFWSLNHLVFLRPLNYAALLVETLFPFLFVMLRGRTPRLLLLASAVAFHAGMLATLRIPFANLACISAAVVLFGKELMERPRRDAASSSSPIKSSLGFAGVASLLFVSCLTLAMLSSVWMPEWRSRAAATERADVGFGDGLQPLQKPFFAALWCIGVVQQYQLFNWIDERNFVVDYDGVREWGSGTAALSPSTIFPRSTRGVLLQTYVHNVTWMQIPAWRQPELRRAIFSRAARRYCGRAASDERVTLYSTVRRIRGLKSDDEGQRALTMRFQCVAGEAQMLAMNLNP